MVEYGQNTSVNITAGSALIFIYILNEELITCLNDAIRINIFQHFVHYRMDNFLAVFHHHQSYCSSIKIAWKSLRFLAYDNASININRG